MNSSSFETPATPSSDLGGEALEILEGLPDYDAAQATELNLALRKKGHSPEAVTAALTQSRLRSRARGKLGEFADRMLFTDHGLQQSTRLPVAVQHAGRFHAAGVEHVVDLGCGLGADSLAFASSGMRVSAVESDPLTAALTEVNLRPFPEANVINLTAEEHVQDKGLLHSAADPTRGLWLDPARRNERSRIWDPEEFSPPLSFVTELAKTSAPMGVKLGPGLPHELIPEEAEAEWVSVDGSLVEVTLWFNMLARPGVARSAVVLKTDVQNPVQLTDRAELTSEFRDTPVAPEDTLGAEGLRQAAEQNATLWEPDPAVIRAGLVADLCAEMGGDMLDEHIAYFLTDSPQDTLLARGYQVHQVLPYQPKRLKRWVQEQGFTSLEIKKRGVDVVPEQLRTQLLPKKKPAGPPHHGVLLVTRLGEERLLAHVTPL